VALGDGIGRCIDGVGRNLLAAELCKVALGLESHAEVTPLSFLSHRILCGNSLVEVCDRATLKNGVPEDAYELEVVLIPASGKESEARWYIIHLK
jgi:hypothetical protein